MTRKKVRAATAKRRLSEGGVAGDLESDPHVRNRDPGRHLASSVRPLTNIRKYNSQANTTYTHQSETTTRRQPLATQSLSTQEVITANQPINQEHYIVSRRDVTFGTINRGILHNVITTCTVK